MALRIYLFILVLNMNIFADDFKSLMEDAIVAAEKDSFALPPFEKKMEALCLDNNKKACNLMPYIKFAHDTIVFSEELSKRLQIDSNNVFSALFTEYLQFAAKNPIKNLTPIEVPSIQSCMNNAQNCRDAGYLHQKLFGLSDDEYYVPSFLWLKGCENNDFESCKMIAKFYSTVNNETFDIFFPDSALKYIEKFCKIKGIKANDICKEKERIKNIINENCKKGNCSDDDLGGKEAPYNKSHLKCIQDVCKNAKSGKYSGQCKSSDFVVFEPYSKSWYFEDLFSEDILRCFNEEWDYCSYEGGNLYEHTRVNYGTSFHLLFLLYMACSNGSSYDCNEICDWREDSKWLPFDKSILDEMGVTCK